MERYTGKSIFRKIAIGKIFFYEKNDYVVKRTHTDERQPDSFRNSMRKLSKKSVRQEQLFLKSTK